MIIYNITTHVSWNIHEKWKEWMLGDCIPQILGIGIFSGYQLVRLLEVDEEEGPTYAIQLYANEKSSISTFRESHLASMEHREKALWGDNAYSFASVMEVIN